jgi:hypothetical protein
MAAVVSSDCVIASDAATRIHTAHTAELQMELKPTPQNNLASAALCWR